jgi:hypothetical protein
VGLDAAGAALSAAAAKVRFPNDAKRWCRSCCSNMQCTGRAQLVPPKAIQPTYLWCHRVDFDAAVHAEQELA